MTRRDQKNVPEEWTPASVCGPSPGWFETILCSLNEGVFCVDKEYRITCFNLAAGAITGVPREQALGRQCREVFRSNICQTACAIRYTIESGKALTNLAVTISDAGGVEKPVSISTALLRDEGGATTGGVVTFRDLSVIDQMKRELEGPQGYRGIISKSSRMQQIFEMLPVVAESDSSVLITGESGTGKGLVARAIHEASRRSGGALITVNCAAIPDTLLESELFGYKAGAFTNAGRDKPGRFASAEGGTLFLDEIGDVSPSVQAKLLRVLQEKTYEPLGSVTSVDADVRIIAATNHDLQQLMKTGDFRTDLYYRINVIRLELPPLRERREDIPLLIEHFIAYRRALGQKDITGLDHEALAVLMGHEFPGNVRELQNIIEHAFILCPGGLISTEHLPPEIRGVVEPLERGLNEMVARYERDLLLRALADNDGNRLEAARSLGIHKSTLFRKMNRLGISTLDSDTKKQ